MLLVGDSFSPFNSIGRLPENGALEFASYCFAKGIRKRTILEAGCRGGHIDVLETFFEEGDKLLDKDEMLKALAENTVEFAKWVLEHNKLKSVKFEELTYTHLDTYLYLLEKNKVKFDKRKVQRITESSV